MGRGRPSPKLPDAYDLILYFDKTRQRILWNMWDGSSSPSGADQPRKIIFWKEFYYCDYYLLDAQSTI